MNVTANHPVERDASQRPLGKGLASAVRAAHRER